ncbi:hypothetical protein [Ruminococcus sp.]|uniref:hypothetical protein n=1 Tax=Ruminococcus sp. TaxID=41978 RepID=UPI00386626FB
MNEAWQHKQNRKKKTEKAGTVPAKQSRMDTQHFAEQDSQADVRICSGAGCVRHCICNGFAGDYDDKTEMRH